MKATRRTQPYRRQSQRVPTSALSAMLAGRSLYGQNPARTLQDLLAANRKKSKRRR
jgi:hypothetical protein